MKLFLASEIKHPESIAELREFAGGFEGKSIAYIPTAANGETLYGVWKTESATWKLVQTLGATVVPVVLEEYKNSRVLDVLRNKDIIWFAGGAASYLMYWVRRCGIDTNIRELLETGSIYVGSSAGSMVAAPTLSTAEWFLGEPETGGGVIPGFGLVDFDIYPHFREELLPEIKKHWRGTKLFLLKNGQAITVEDGKIHIPEPVISLP